MQAVPAHSDARVGHPGRRHAHSSAGNDVVTRPRILLIESGSTPARRLTRRLIERGFSVAVESWDRGVDVSCVEECDVLVLDFDSADEDAPSTMRTLREVRPSLPTIVLDRGDPDHAARVLNSGADDYMVKPYRFDELRARIEVLLRTAAPRTRLRTATRAWGCDELASNRVDADVRSLRRKLGNDAIVTVPGVGYRLD